MKKFVVVTLMALIALPAFAARIARQPEFNNGSIMMSANGGLCGGITIDPIKEGDSIVDVRVMSQRFAESIFGDVKPGKPLSDWVEVPVGGMRVGYDWAGPRPSFHYRIYCQRKNQYGQWGIVDCKRAVTIRDVQHNRPCVWGPAGASASYEPLNMRVDKTK